MPGQGTVLFPKPKSRTAHFPRAAVLQWGRVEKRQRSTPHRHKARTCFLVVLRYGRTDGSHLEPSVTKKMQALLEPLLLKTTNLLRSNYLNKKYIYILK